MAMERESNSDVIVIDDEPGTSAMEVDTNEGSSQLEIQEDLLTLYNKFFPEPIVDLSDRISVKDKKGTTCSNVRCKSTSDELVVPTQSAVSYFNLPSRSLLLCKACIAVADEFMKDMLEKYYNGESLYDCTFPPTNPVVLIDSDGSDVEEDIVKNSLPGISEEGSEAIKKAVTALVKKHINVYNLDQQVEKGKEKVEQTLEKLEIGYKELIADTQAASNDLFTCMQSLYETFAPKTESLEPLDIPYEEMRPSRLHREKERKMQHTNLPKLPPPLLNTYKPPPDLPPTGSPLRPKPMPGQRFYVKNHDPNHPDWLPATVISHGMKDDTRLLSDRGFGDVYRVRIDPKETGTGVRIHFADKDICESLMAYYTQPAVRLMLGSRVIAVSNSYTINPSTFIAGVIAEPPSVTNKYRYLVFFDDGYAQYVRHNDVRLIVRSKPNVSEYFQQNNQRFIKDYFNTYPERPMLKINVMECVRVMRKGVWNNCRVIEVDASLIRVLFLKENYAEWIYRGSSRLRPLFDHSNAIKGDLRKRISRGVVNPNGPFIMYDLADSDDEPEYQGSTDSSLSNDDQPDKLRRAVAKKSTNRLPDIIEPPSPPQPLRRYAKRITRQQYGKIETMIPSNTIQPIPYKKHTCSSDCVAAVHYDERKTKSVNPLVVPSLFGFRRDSDMSLIFYQAPCGRKLRSMLDVLKYTTETKILIGLDHFDFDPCVHIFDEFIVPPQHILHKDLSHGRENVQIPVVNSINAQIPDMMQYMTERRGLDGVYLNLEESFLVGCDCTDNCQDKSKCLCQQMTITEAVIWSKYFNIEKPEEAGYTHRRLPIGLPSGIWECNNRCKCCRKTCLNRVAQYPLKVKLQLFKTKKKGWGVRCVNDIPCGTFICVYNGNILTESNANEGGLRHGDEYFAELDYIECMEGTKANYEPTVNINEDDLVTEDEALNDSGEEFVPEILLGTPASYSRKKLRRRKSSSVRSSDSDESHDSDGEVSFRQPQSFDVVDGDDDDEDENKLPYPSVRQLFGKDEAVYVMDAKTAGNIGRYFNHSCDPNVHVQSVFVDTHDLRFPWIAFFSQKYIRAGQELTWDYRYEPGKVPGKRLICYCGAPNCRKRLL